MIENEIPKPGSKEACECGCTCPMIDNHYGLGVFYDGVYHWWRNADCQLHGTWATWSVVLNALANAGYGRTDDS